MKRLLLFISGIALVLSLSTQCTKDIDTEFAELYNTVQELNQRVTALENGYNALNAYSALLDNLQNGKLIENVKDNGDGTFTITFTDKSTVNITAGKGEKGDKGDKGDQGLQGNPGNDGTNGANGATPEFKIEDGKWYVRYGDGEWTELGAAVADTPTFFSDVHVDGDYLHLILIDGTSLIINTKTGEVFNENLDAKFFMYGGKKYPIVKLDDGRWWMAAPLAYVPAGKKVSADPVEDAGIWYTYKIIEKNVTEANVNNNDAYLYDYATAFGLDSYKDITYGTQAEWEKGNYREFEGVQGICPPGWYIPTRADFLKLVGVSNKNDTVGETAAVNDNTAVYYDSSLNGGGSTVVRFNEAGWNFSFMGCRSKTSTAQVGAYNAAAPIDATKCSVEDWIGLPGLSQVMCSTPYKPNTAGNNTQYFCLMTTFTAAYKTGRLTLSYGNYLHGMEVRCVRKADAE